MSEYISRIKDGLTGQCRDIKDKEARELITRLRADVDNLSEIDTEGVERLKTELESLKNQLNSLDTTYVTDTELQELATELESLKNQLNSLDTTYASDTELQGLKEEITPAVAFAESEREKSKNLITLKTQTFTANGLTIVVENDLVTVTGTATGITGVALNDLTPTLKGEKTYTYSIKNLINNGDWFAVPIKANVNGDDIGNFFSIASDNLSHSVTTMSDSIVKEISFYCEGGTIDCSFNLQLEEGAEATEYVPYNGDILHQKDLSVSEGVINERLNTLEDSAKVVESFISSDGLTWYRIWSDGWKECGSTVSSSSGQGSYTLPIAFSNTNYIVTGNIISGNSSNYGLAFTKSSNQTITFTKWYSGGLSGDNFTLYCCGY